MDLGRISQQNRQLVNGILQAGNSKLQVVGILCGLAKVDCINHDISVRLMKLEFFVALLRLLTV